MDHGAVQFHQDFVFLREIGVDSIFAHIEEFVKRASDDVAKEIEFQAPAFERVGVREGGGAVAVVVVDDDVVGLAGYLDVFQPRDVGEDVVDVLDCRETH